MEFIQSIKDVLLKRLNPRPRVSKKTLLTARTIQSQIEGVFKYLCEHNLLFFLLVTRQFDTLRKLFQDKSELINAAILRKKIKKKRKLLKAKRKHILELYLENNRHRQIYAALQKTLVYSLEKKSDMSSHFDNYTPLGESEKQSAIQTKLSFEIPKEKAFCRYRFFVRSKNKLEVVLHKEHINCFAAEAQSSGGKKQFK